MIGMKELGLVTTGRKLISKYKKNFTRLTADEFCIRIYLVDENRPIRKIQEYSVNSGNLMDYLENGLRIDDYQIYRIEVFKPSEEK